MTITVKDSTGTLRQITRITVKDRNGVMRQIRAVKVKDSTGTLRTVYSSISATINRTSLEVSGSSLPIISSPSIIVTPTGGTAPYTYSWTIVDIIGTGTVTALSSSSSSTSFSAAGMLAYEPKTVRAVCTVTDANNQTAVVECILTFNYFESEFPYA